jgi:hypothetical protein
MMVEGRSAMSPTLNKPSGARVAPCEVTDLAPMSIDGKAAARRRIRVEATTPRESCDDHCNTSDHLINQLHAYAYQMKKFSFANGWADAFTESDSAPPVAPCFEREAVASIQ